jgi:proline racemase
MPGIRRAVALGFPHHVIQRGNNRVLGGTFGNKGFVVETEKKLERRLFQRPRGRPIKKQDILVIPSGQKKLNLFA